MAQPDFQLFSVQEYLWEEEHSQVKREYLKGQVYNMSGGSPEHSQIALNLAAGLKRELRGTGCRAFTSDLKVGMALTPDSLPKRKRNKFQGEDSFITYPDTSVVCGELEFFRDNRHTLANPIVLFEVLSPSTRNYDRSVKLENYQTIPSLLYYVMIDSEQVRVVYYQRIEAGNWLQSAPLSDPRENFTLKLPTATINLTVAELYDEVIFEDEE
jgi:Uma2 family endonuclease